MTDVGRFCTCKDLGGRQMSRSHASVLGLGVEEGVGVDGDSCGGTEVHRRGWRREAGQSSLCTELIWEFDRVSMERWGTDAQRVCRREAG